MEFFHFLTGGPYPIDLARREFRRNFKEIKNLILIKNLCYFLRAKKSTARESIRLCNLSLKKEGNFKSLTEFKAFLSIPLI